MINLGKKNPDEQSEIFSRLVINSSILAVIFTVPALTIFLVIYYGTGNLLVGAVLGFGIHFVTLAFSGRISKWLMRFQK